MADVATEVEEVAGTGQLSGHLGHVMGPLQCLVEHVGQTRATGPSSPPDSAHGHVSRAWASTRANSSRATIWVRYVLVAATPISGPGPGCRGRRRPPGPSRSPPRWRRPAPCDPSATRLAEAPEGCRRSRPTGSRRWSGCGGQRWDCDTGTRWRCRRRWAGGPTPRWRTWPPVRRGSCCHRPRCGPARSSRRSRHSDRRPRRGPGFRPAAVPGQGVGHRVRLLVDLLGHEVVVATLTGRGHVPSMVSAVAPRVGPVQRGHPHRSRVGARPTGRLRGRTGDRVRPSRAGMSEARNDAPSPSPTMSGETRRAATISSGSSAWMAATAKEPRTSREGAPEALGQGRPPANSASTRWARTSESVSDTSTCPSADQGPGQLGVVLDDAVVDQGQPAGAVEMGMGVLGGRACRGWPNGCGRSRCPSGRASCDPCSRRSLTEWVPWAARIRHRVSSVDEGDAGRVVAAVLQTAQTLDEQRQCVVGACDPDDSAHVPMLPTARGR